MYERGHEGCIDYFVVGAGGAETIDPDLHAPGVAAGTSATSYLVITVAGSTASAEAKDTNGNVVDRLDLKPASCAPSADAGTPADVGAASDGQLATTVDATTDAANAAEASDAAAALDAALADGSSARAASPSGCGCSAAHGPWLALGAALSSLLRRNRPR
jgi:hypothetical protein